MTTYTPAEAAEIVNMAASAKLTLAESAKLFSDGLTPVDVASTARPNPPSRDATSHRRAAAASR